MEAGQDPGRFWSLTPREIRAVLGGVANRLRREHDELAWMAWHVAALTRAKKLPKLKDMLSKKASATPKAKQSVDEQIAMAMRWTAALSRKQ